MSEKISNKERMKIPRQVMPEQDPVQRRANFSEVNLGFTEELAKMEALVVFNVQNQLVLKVVRLV